MDLFNKLLKKEDKKPVDNTQPGSVVVNTGTISPSAPNTQSAPSAAGFMQTMATTPTVPSQPQSAPMPATTVPQIPPAQPTQLVQPVLPAPTEQGVADVKAGLLDEMPGSLDANDAKTAKAEEAKVEKTIDPNKTPSFTDTFKSMFMGGSPQTKQLKARQEEIEIPSLTEDSATTHAIADVKDIIAPPSIEVDFNHMQVGKKYYRTYFAYGYPRFVDANWLSPLINFDHALSISTFYYPVDSDMVLQKLKRKIGEMEATIYSDMESGKVLDPKVKVSLSDAHALQENIAKGEEKFFHFALYVTIQADNDPQLDEVGKAVEATMAAIGIIAKPTTLQMEQGMQSTMPTAHDALYLTRNMDTTSIATTFPFVTSELTMNEGILFGLNKHNKSLVIFDRFQMENANTVVFARSGAGKSYLIKLEALRSLMMGIGLIIIDPEKEYQDLCRALDGDYITFSQDEGAKINPFDIADYEKGEGKDALRNKILMLHSFFNIMFGGLNNIEKGILDRAMILTYKEKGITVDPETQDNEPPLLEDLFKVLQGMAEEDAHNLARRLERFMRGSAAGVFNKPTNIKFTNRFTVFSLRDLQDELRPMAMFLMLDYIWTKVRNDKRKRVLIVEEAWYMMQNLDSAKFMYSVAKRARKYFLGITTISQDVEDFLLNDFGRAVVTNSAIQILMKQSTAAIERVQAVFGLSEGEKSFLLNAEVGEGLFFAGTNHVAINVVSSNQEHLLITTNPKDLEVMKQQGIDPLSAGNVSEMSNPYDPNKKLTEIGKKDTEDDYKVAQSLKQLERDMAEKEQLEKIQNDAREMMENQRKLQAEMNAYEGATATPEPVAPEADASEKPAEQSTPTNEVKNPLENPELSRGSAPVLEQVPAAMQTAVPATQTTSQADTFVDILNQDHKPTEAAKGIPAAPAMPQEVKNDLLYPTNVTQGFNVDNPDRPDFNKSVGNGTNPVQ